MKKPSIAAVYLFVGGMVMVFDSNGEQIPDYQGHAKDVASTILRDAPDAARFCFGKWRGEGFSVTRDEWALLAQPWRSHE